MADYQGVQWVHALFKCDVVLSFKTEDKRLQNVCSVYWDLDEGGFTTKVSSLRRFLELSSDREVLAIVRANCQATSECFRCYQCGSLAELRSRTDFLEQVEWLEYPAPRAWVCDTCLAARSPASVVKACSFCGLTHKGSFFENGTASICMECVADFYERGDQPAPKVSSVSFTKHRVELHGRVGFICEYPGGKCWAYLSAPFVKLGGFPDRQVAEKTLLERLDELSVAGSGRDA